MKTWTSVKREIFREKMNLFSAQNNAIRTNYVKTRIDKTQQNGRCRLWGDRDEAINYIISECDKLAQREYKTRHYWVGMMIHWELCKKFKSDYMNKWHTPNPESVLENETNKFLWDFDNQISARRPDLVILKNIKTTELWTLLSRVTTGRQKKK